MMKTYTTLIALYTPGKVEYRVSTVKTGGIYVFHSNHVKIGAM
jgi:hypothetical protein